MNIDLIIAVWCLRVVSVVGIVVATVALIMACLNYVYHSGKHAATFCAYLYRRSKPMHDDLAAALDRELRLRKILDNVRVKYGNDAVKDDE